MSVDLKFNISIADKKYHNDSIHTGIGSDSTTTFSGSGGYEYPFLDFNLKSLNGRIFINAWNEQTLSSNRPRLAYVEYDTYYSYDKDLPLENWNKVSDEELSNFYIASFPESTETVKEWFVQPITWFNQEENKDIFYKIIAKFTFTNTILEVSGYYISKPPNGYYPSYPSNLELYKDKFTEFEVAILTFNIKLIAQKPIIRNFELPTRVEISKDVEFNPNEFEDNFKYISAHYEKPDETKTFWYYAIGENPEPNEYSWYSDKKENETSPIPQFVIFPNDSQYNRLVWSYRIDGGNWVEFNNSNLSFKHKFTQTGNYQIKIDAYNTEENVVAASYIYPEIITVGSFFGRINGKIALSVLYSPFTNNIISGDNKYYDNYYDAHDLFDETRDNSNSELFNEELSLDKFYFGNITDSNTSYQNSLVNVSRSDKPTIIFDFDQTKLPTEKYNYPLLYVPYNKFSNKRVIIGGISDLNNKKPLNNIKLENKDYFCPRNISIIDVEDYGPLIDVETGEEV